MSTPDPAPLLAVAQLTVLRGSIHALERVSFEVPNGGIVALVGGNGSGKSTVLRSISGFLRPVTGTITFLGRELTRLPTHEIVALGIGHVPEGRMVFSQFTVAENLALGAHFQKDASIVAAALDDVLRLFPRLKERLRQAAGTLSTGEQEMLAIARALMGQPRLLMLDEPSLGIAPRLVDAIYETLLELNRTRGITLLIAEQSARRALTLSEQALVLDEGRVAVSGPSRDVRKDPRLKTAYLGG